MPRLAEATKHRLLNQQKQAVDCETANVVGPLFTNLTKVDFLGVGGGLINYYSLDDITVSPASTVPEPATILLLGTGLALFAARTRRRPASCEVN